MFVGYVLAAMRSADPRGGLCCARYTMAGYAGRPFGVSGPYTHRLGPLRTPWQDLLANGTRIGEKPGREACVVCQVVADTLARLPLEGCRDT